MRRARRRFRGGRSCVRFSLGLGRRLSGVRRFRSVRCLVGCVSCYSRRRRWWWRLERFRSLVGGRLRSRSVVFSRRYIRCFIGRYGGFLFGFDTGSRFLLGVRCFYLVTGVGSVFYRVLFFIFFKSAFNLIFLKCFRFFMYLWCTVFRDLKFRRSCLFIFFRVLFFCSLDWGWFVGLGDRLVLIVLFFI